MAIPSGRRRIRRALAGGATTAVLVGLLTTPGTAFAAAPAPDQRVGKVPTAPADAVKTEAPADSTPLNLSVTLSPRDQGALTSFIAAVSDPKSPQYRKYLKTGEFGQVFGADKATVDATVKALTDAGLHPGPLDANGLTIPITTTVGEAKKAFATDFAGYKLADGTTAYANTEAPKLSGRIAGQVLAVAGLNNVVKAKSHLAVNGKRDSAETSSAPAVTPHYSSGTPVMCQGTRNALSNRGLQDGVDYFTPSTLAPVYQESHVNGGAGATVAIFSLEEYSDTALGYWQQCFGTTTSVSRVKVNGGPTIQPTSSNDIGFETAMDIEAVIGMAPNADILVYQGPDVSRASTADISATYQKIVSDNRAQVISTSWGKCELDHDPGMRAAEHLTFQQAAAQGQTVIASSGDSGSTGCYYDGTADARLSTDYPAGDPYVTGAGGTRITDAFSTPSESVWNSGGGASGGGVAKNYPLDSATGFQAGIKGAGYSDACTAAAGQTCRQVPDVAALSDPSQGYVVFYYMEGTTYYYGRGGGTSLAAPLWAGALAHVNSDAQCAASGPVGYLNPQLYKLKGSNAFYDVLTGNNNVTASGYTGGLYAAGAGYDLATGLGSPRVDQLTAQLCAQLPESPAGTFASLAAPARFLDTRQDHALDSRSERSLQITGVSGVPASGVTSVVLNVTVTEPAEDGHLIVYPSGVARPTTSNLNWQRGKTVPNLVTVPVGKDGKVVFFNGAWGAIQLIADVEGYYTTATNGAKYQASGPSRVLDTRTSGGRVPGYSEKVLTKAQLGAPAGAKAVVANVTVTDTLSDGHLTVYPSGVTRPNTSNLNWVAGQTTANQVIVPLGTDGSIRLYNAADPSNVIVDVFGFLGTDGASFHSTTPHRLMDTRVGLGTMQGAMNGRTIRNLPLDFGGKLSGAKAVVLNVTVTEPRDAGYLALYPYGQNSSTSNLNFVAGQTVANMVTVPVGANGTVEILNGAWSDVQVIVDVFGYYN